MSHADQTEFFRISRVNFPEYFTGKRVLEVGSLDINGSIRALFNGCEYVGLDVGEGPGVDVVISGEDYHAPDDSFDVVASAECMEHNPAWEATIRNMLRMLRPGGMFLLTCAAPGRVEHGTSRTTPWASPLTVAKGQDYYQNLDYRDFERRDLLSPLTVRAHWTNWRARDLYWAGIKGRQRPAKWSSYTAAMDTWIAGIHRASPAPFEERAALSLFGRRAYEQALPLLRLPRRVRDKVRRELSRLRRTG